MAWNALPQARSGVAACWTAATSRCNTRAQADPPRSRSRNSRRRRPHPTRPRRRPRTLRPRRMPPSSSLNNRHSNKRNNKHSNSSNSNNNRLLPSTCRWSSSSRAKPNHSLLPRTTWTGRRALCLSLIFSNSTRLTLKRRGQRATC